MKFRSETSISERQLVFALAASGRKVSLDELSVWRNDGLLPPLASHGLGTGAGRRYYWGQPDILFRAQLAYDALQKYGRSDAATISLWLNGFEVSPARFRRAWLHRSKMNGAAKVRKATGNITAKSPAISSLPDALVSAAFHAAACIGGASDSAKIALTVLERASVKLGYDDDHGTQAQSGWRLVMTVLLALDGSDLVSAASEQEIRDAQTRLSLSLRFLRRCADSPDTLVECLGAPLFLFILAMVRSGQHTVLDTVQDEMERAARDDEVIGPQRPVTAEAGVHRAHL